MSNPLLETESLYVTAGDKLLCANLSLRVHPGEFWCVLGKNGAGKSTLLHTLAGLKPPVKGAVRIEGSNIEKLPLPLLAQRRGLLTQHQLDAFSSPVLEAVLAGRHPYQTNFKWESSQDLAIARDALAAVGLSEFSDKDVLSLSGGERQRVALAALIAQDPNLMLLDEPTAQQDAAAQLAVMLLVQNIVEGDLSIKGKGKAAIAACHDINLVSRFASHVLIMSAEQHWMGETAKILKPDVLQEAFGCPFHVVQGPEGKLFIPATT